MLCNWLRSCCSCCWRFLSAVWDFGIVSRYSWFWKSLHTTDRGAEFHLYKKYDQLGWDDSLETNYSKSFKLTLIVIKNIPTHREFARSKFILIYLVFILFFSALGQEEMTLVDLIFSFFFSIFLNWIRYTSFHFFINIFILETKWKF